MDGLFKFLSLALQPTKFYYLFMHDTYSKIAFYIMEVTKVGWEYTPRGGQLLGTIRGDYSAITIYVINYISMVSVFKKCIVLIISFVIYYFSPISFGFVYT